MAEPVGIAQLECQLDSRWELEPRWNRFVYVIWNRSGGHLFHCLRQIYLHYHLQDEQQKNA